MCLFLTVPLSGLQCVIVTFPGYTLAYFWTSIKWTPGHADIRGYCISNELAKEAAEEAK